MESQTTRCQSASCETSRQEYCCDHQKILCHECSDTFHFQCNTQRISKPDEMIRSIEMLERFTQILNEEARNYELLEQIKGLKDTLSCIENTISKLKSEAASALASDHFLKYDKLKLQAREFKSDILNSKYGNSESGVNKIFELLFYSQLFKCSKPEEKKNLEGIQKNKDTRTDKPQEAQINTDSPATDTLGNNENVTQNSENNEDSETNVKKDEPNSENVQEIIHKLNERVKFLEDKSKKDEFIKEGQIKDLEEMKKQMEKIQDQSSKQKEDQKEKEKKDLIEPGFLTIKGKFPKYQSLYINYFKVHNEFDPDTFLYLNLDRDCDRDFLIALEKQCVQLPEIKEISIDNIKREHLNHLNNFLLKSIPEKLSIFRLENCQKHEIYYYNIRKELLNILPRVTQEICIAGLSCNHKDCKTIITNSVKARSLEFKFCKLRKESDNNRDDEFGEETSELKYLCFRNCEMSSSGCSGIISYYFMEEILKFILKSPIKDNLETLSVYDTFDQRKSIASILKNLHLENVKLNKELGEELYRELGEELDEILYGNCLTFNFQ
ncbi:unnamed protein product [Moneuplotes crassus]|uniref:Uncharacterized protein n=1 Tax=Euplotes crassus TaxID=5936 RepID=A0AAD1UEC7_EUPCR|nr:unnamed protein product [Moneuplotes crassus]